jgi:hypothetical protein
MQKLWIAYNQYMDYRTFEKAKESARTILEKFGNTMSCSEHPVSVRDALVDVGVFSEDIFLRKVWARLSMGRESDPAPRVGPGADGQILSPPHEVRLSMLVLKYARDITIPVEVVAIAVSRRKHVLAMAYVQLEGIFSEEVLHVIFKWSWRDIYNPCLQLAHDLFEDDRVVRNALCTGIMTLW